MATFLDKLIEDGFGIPEPDMANFALPHIVNNRLQLCADAMRSATAFKIDNVAEYYFQTSDFGKEWERGDFPTIAPPYQNFFMEFSPKGVSASLPFSSVGILTLSQQYKTPEYYHQTKDRMNFTLNLINEETPKWMVSATIFTQTARKLTPMAMGTLQYFLDDEGELIYQTREGKVVPAWLDAFYTVEVDDLGIYKQLQDCSWLATSFLHCKNITLTTHTPEPHLSKIRTKRNKPQLVTFKTLDITPMKTVLSNEGNVESSGLKNALHCCRGHFKDYTEKGLFGKNRGIYWWNEQARGSIEQGVVFKDYAINQPIS